jgi:hypothetical protein
MNLRALGDATPGLNLTQAVARAVQEPTLLDALSWIAIWDNDRAVRQAFRGVRDPNSGALWETNFLFLFKQVTEAWNAKVVRVLVKNQTAGSLDGIYTAAATLAPPDPQSEPGRWLFESIPWEDVAILSRPRWEAENEREREAWAKVEADCMARGNDASETVRLAAPAALGWNVIEYGEGAIGLTSKQRDDVRRHVLALKQRIDDLKLALGDGANWFDRARAAEAERDSLRAQLEAAEQHVKVLNQAGEDHGVQIAEIQSRAELAEQREKEARKKIVEERILYNDINAQRHEVLDECDRLKAELSESTAAHQRTEASREDWKRLAESRAEMLMADDERKVWQDETMRLKAQLAEETAAKERSELRYARCVAQTDEEIEKLESELAAMAKVAEERGQLFSEERNAKNDAEQREASLADDIVELKLALESERAKNAELSGYRDKYAAILEKCRKAPGKCFCGVHISHVMGDESESEPAKSPDAKPQTYSVDESRSRGWSVAVHNDYRLDGVPMTFWLFTKDGRAVKGEGLTDNEALANVLVGIENVDGAAPVPPAAVPDGGSGEDMGHVIGVDLNGNDFCESCGTTFFKPPKEPCLAIKQPEQAAGRESK